MQIYLARTLMLTVAAALAGCAIVSSQRLVPGARNGVQGVAYALPMARVPIVLAANAGQIILRLDAPLVVADPDHTYTAQRMNNPFSADQVTIEVDPATGFLSSVSAVGKDETLAVLEKLLLPKTGATPEAQDAQGEELYRAEVNPADNKELENEERELNKALTAFLKAQNKACTQPSDVCAEYTSTLRLAPEIKLSGRRAALLDEAGKAAAGGSAAPADCSIGVCYRQPQPFVLKVSLGAIVRSVIVNIPNASAVVAVPLERNAFVTTSHTLTFEQGTLKSATVDRPSSALALVSSPLAVVSGVIGSITKPLSEFLKIDTSGQYQAKAEEAKAKTEEVKAKAGAQAAANSPSPPKTLTTLTLGSSRTTSGLVTDSVAVPGVTVSTTTPASGARLSTPSADGKPRN